MTPMGADAALFDVAAAEAAVEVVAVAALVFGSPGAAVVTPAGGVLTCYEVRERDRVRNFLSVKDAGLWEVRTYES